MVIRENLTESIDELAITKAAAWAWYERGSWFEHKSLRESDCRRTSDHTRRPSRYKLEAMKTPDNDTQELQPCVNGSLFCTERAENSLLDMYEIERISRELDCYMDSGGVRHNRKWADGGHCDGRVASFSEVRKTKKENKNKSEKVKGFWIGRPMACGSSRYDVVNSRLPKGGRRPQKDHLLVSGIMNSRRPIIHG